MNEMQRSFGWAIWLAASLILSGCASRPPVPCPPVQILKPDLTGFPAAKPEGYFTLSLQGWISEVSDSL
jgi:hypothetical protein